MPRSDENSHDFLLLHYDRLDFLVDRYQFSGSSSLDRLNPLKNSRPYLDQWGFYNGEKLLMFDMNRYLMDLFRCGQAGNMKLCLILEPDDFLEPGRTMLRRLLEKSGKLSMKYLGMIVSSQAEIKTMNLREFNLVPPGVGELLKKRGLYGCRFPVEERIQFFVDLQKFFFYSLESSLRRDYAYTSDR